MSGPYNHTIHEPQSPTVLRVEPGSATAPAVGFVTDSDSGLYLAAADTVAVSTGGAERLRVDAVGRVGIGRAPTVPLEVGGSTPQIRLYDGATVDARWYTAPGSGATVFGNLSGHALALHAGGSEFLRGQPDGKIGIGTTTPSARLHVGGSAAALWSVTSAVASPAMRAYATSAGFVNQVTLLDVDRPASNSFMFLLARSGVASTSDTKFALLGDGNAHADGAWTGGGADYAEFFEWADGNPQGEDRRGLTVVLEEGRIRPAMMGDDPGSVIGAVSSTPTMVGDAAWNRWTGKYLRDAYGALLTEPYEIVEWEEEVAEPTETVETRSRCYAADAVPEGVVAPADARCRIERRPVLNPAFDPAMPYVPRAERPEWSVVGLVGKLRIRSGQPIGSRWIRLRPLSESVEEWLVR
jgi:hypothetical protein